MNLSPFIIKIDRFFSLVTPKDLTRGVKISTGIHIALLFFILLSPIIFPHKHRRFIPTAHMVQLVNLPGSVVGAPPKTQPAIPKPPAPKPKASEPEKIIEKPNPTQTAVKKKPEMVIPEKKTVKTPPPPKEKAQSLEEKLASRLKQLDKGKKENTDKKWKEPDSPARPINNNFEEPAVTGNLGVSGSMGLSTQSDFPFQYYLENIHAKISSCWTDPQMSIDKKYSAIISFTILKTGEVINISVKESSGVAGFDQSGIKAIELAKPFPQLPPGFLDSELIVNVEFALE